MVEKFKLNNGVEIPAVGLGVFRLEDNIKTQQAVETALAMGYRHIDTAKVYGNEEGVGMAIKASGIAREDIFVTTKLWNDDQRSGLVEEAFDASLKRLNLDYVDLYLIHWPVAEKIQETWKKLEQIYKSGRVKAIGVSNFREHHLKALKEVSDLIPAVNQIELHPYLTQTADVDYCNKEGIKVQAWSPFTAAQTGLLTEKTLTDIAAKYAKSAAQVVLRWDYQRGIITIPKSANESRMKENISIFDFELTNDEMSQVSSLNKNQRVGSDPDNFNF